MTKSDFPPQGTTLNCRVVVRLLIIVLMAWQSVDADTTSTSWDYKSDKYGFVITLPDSGWQEKPSSVHGIAGSVKKGYAMRVDLFVIPCRTEASFQALEDRVKNEMDSFPKMANNSHEKGKTTSGHFYQYSRGTEKNADAPSGVYLRQSVVWLEDRNIAVRTCFQGESQNRSALAQSVDPKLLETAAKSICLSVK
jgi:hypothetical protein